MAFFDKLREKASIVTSVGGPPTLDELDAGGVFDVLKNPRRRYVIRRLDGDRLATMDSLASGLAAEETGLDVSEIDHTSSDHKRVYVSLHQTHIPRLEGAGVISRDGDGKMALIQPAGDFEGVAWLLDQSTRLERSGGSSRDA